MSSNYTDEDVILAEQYVDKAKEEYLKAQGNIPLITIGLIVFGNLIAFLLAAIVIQLPDPLGGVLGAVVYASTVFFTLIKSRSFKKNRLELFRRNVESTQDQLIQIKELAYMDQKETHEGQKKCPMCQEYVLLEATKCKHCKSAIA